MPIDHDEMFGSPVINLGSNPTAEITYRIRGSEDEVEISNYAAAQFPLLFLNMVRDNIRLQPTGFQRWSGRANYIQAPSTGSFTDAPSSFETSGGTQHIKFSRETLGSYAPNNGTAADFKGAINCNGKTVKGTDVVVPVYKFTEPLILPAILVNQAYRLNLFAATGKTNSGSFKGFDAGEVLFLGATGAPRGENEYAITGRFAASPNLTNVSIGDITGISKGGWNYLWCYFEDGVGENTLLKKPLFAYTERVYDSTSLNGFGF